MALFAKALEIVVLQYRNNEYLYRYIYIYIEREREGDICIGICIYIRYFVISCYLLIYSLINDRVLQGFDHQEYHLGGSQSPFPKPC